MNLDWYILAQRDSDDNWQRIVFGLLFVAFWIFSSIAGAIAKRKEQQRREKIRRELERSAERRKRPDVAVPAPPPPMLPDRPDKIPPPPPKIPQPVQRSPFPLPGEWEDLPGRVPERSSEQMRRRQQKQPKRQKQPVPPTVPVATGPIPISHEEAQALYRPRTSAPVPAQPRPPATASAEAIRNWLNPTTMRQQFILTELLQPPISMREK